MKRLLLVFSLLACWVSGSSQTYCTTGLYTIGCTATDDIDDFSFGSFSQTGTGCSAGAYADYTSTPIVVTQSNNYIPLTATTNYVGSEWFGVWVDWNDDGDFDDSGEFMAYSAVSHGSSNPYVDSVLIDNTRPVGIHRMRVRVKFAGTALTSGESCTSFTYGEVHDYAIDVKPDIIGGCTNQFSNFAIDSVLDVSAKITWTPGTGNASWYLEYGTAGFTPGSGTKITGTYPTNQPPVYLSSLTANTAYEIYFGEICNSGADTAYFGNPQSFQTTVSCPAPTGLTAAPTSPTSGVTSWSSLLGTSYEVIYGAEGFNPYSAGTSANTSNTTYNIPSLTANTSYDVYVIADCGSGGTSDTTGPVTFRTPCTIFSAPYNENFDDTASWTSGTGFDNANAIMDPCWSRTPNLATPNAFQMGPRTGSPGSGNGPTQDLTGGNYILGESSLGASGNVAEIVSPAIDVSGLTTPGLYFFQHRYSAGGAIADMYVEVSNDFGTSWDTVYTVTGEIQNAVGDPWALEFVNLVAYTGDTIMLKFLQKSNGCCGDAAIDSVVVDEAPTCPWPTGATVGLTTDTSAILSWNDPTGSSWEIIWGPPGFTQASPGTGTKITSSNPDTVLGLQSNTDYEYYVRTVCGPGNNSIWIGPISFTTKCSPLMAPYFRDFDNDVVNEVPNCWSSYIMGSGSSFASVYVQGTTNSYSSPNALYIYNYVGTVGSDTTMAITPNFSDLDVGDKQVRFKARTTAASESLIIGTLSGGDASSFSPIDTILLGGTYQEYIVMLNTANGYNGTDTYVGLMHSQSGFATTIYVDDFQYEVIPSCAPPLSSSLGANKVSPTSEQIFWGPSAGDSTLYEVGAPGFTPGTGTWLFQGGTADTFALVTGLTPQTDYCYYIMDTCYGIGNSQWIGPYCFQTPCLAQSMPYYESFDSWRPACWDTAGGTFSWVPYITGATDNYVEASFWSYNTGNFALLTSPLVNITQDAQVRFDWSHQYSTSYPNDELIVRAQVAGSGVWDTILQLKGPNDFNDIGAGPTTPGSFTTEEVLLDPLKYTGNNVVIELRANSDWGPDLFVNDFYIENAPACPKLIGLSADGVTDSSVTLDWTMAPSATAYQVWFGPQGFYQGTQTVGGVQTVTMGDSLYMDTLTANTCYEFLVRSICSAGDTSEWEGPVSFCTPCLPYNAPYQETYDLWPLNCWSMDGGSFNWNAFAGPGGDSYAQAPFWSNSSGEAWMTSPVITLGIDKAVVDFDWSHLYSSSYPDEHLIVAVNKVGSPGWDTIVHLQGPTDFNDPTAGNFNTPGNFINHIAPLDSATYANSSIRVRFIAITDWGPDCYVNNFKVRYPVTDDLELIGARFKKDSKCLSNSDTAIFQVQNVLGSTVNFANDPLTVHYEVTGPVNTTSSATVNSGTLPLGDTIEVMATNIDLSQPGNYTLNAWISSSNVNLDPLTDSLLAPVNITIYDDWDVQPDTVVIINNMIDTVVLEAKSPYLEGGNFMITEICHFRGSLTGAPTGGWPTYLLADDYIEITGVPGSDLGGFTLEEWSTTSMLTTHTFAPGTVMGPNGTAIIAVGSYGSSVPSPSNYYYHGPNGAYSSGVAAGRVLKNSSGDIVDAVTYGNAYTFPVAAGVSAADWSGASVNGSGTAGIRLEGPDVNGPTGWLVSSATSAQDPNTLNANVPLPSGAATAGFDWKLNGVTIDTLPKTLVGPYTSSGVYNYIATFNGPCGLQSDTVTVIVNLPGSSPIPTNITASAPACDSIYISWRNAVDSALVEYVPSGSAPGVGTLIVNDSSFAAVGLTPSTNYDFYVANIKGGDTSSYVGPYTINSGTAGAPVAVINYANNGPGGLMYGFDARGGTGDRANYSWDFGGGNTATGDSVGYTFPQGGAYTVTLIVTNACGSDTVSLSLPDVSIVENALSRSLKLYPNPARDVLNVELSLEGKDDVTVRIMDVSGKEVISAIHSKDDKKMEASIDLSELAKGVYMIEVSDGKYTAVRRLVKE